MSDPLGQPPSRVCWNTNQQITSTDLDRMGQAALRSSLHLLAWLCRDLAAGAPLSGFAGPDDCKATLASAPLTVGVAAGLGMLYDSSLTDDWAPHYRPVAVPAPATVALAAHDATDPRIDILCLAPAVVEDLPQSRFVYGNGTPQTLNTRERAGYTLQIVQGTPAASPSAPATPAGALKIAEARVPAISGAATVTDTRPLLRLGQAWAADPAPEYVQPFVPGSGAELRVTATSPASAAVAVAAGEVVIVGPKGVLRRRFEAAALAVPLAASGLRRIDRIVAADGGLLRVAGAESASPVAPTLAPGQVPLARIEVESTGTIDPGDIEDERVREPFDGGEQLRPGSVDGTRLAGGAVGTSKLDDYAVTGIKMAVPPVIPLVTTAAAAPDTTISVQLRDAEGEPVTRTARLLVEILDGDLAPAPALTELEVTTGTAVTAEDKIRLLLDTTAGGVAVVRHQLLASGTARWARFTPIGTPGAPALVSWTTP